MLVVALALGVATAKKPKAEPAVAPTPVAVQAFALAGFETGRPIPVGTRGCYRIDENEQSCQLEGAFAGQKLSLDIEVCGDKVHKVVGAALFGSQALGVVQVADDPEAAATAAANAIVAAFRAQGHTLPEPGPSGVNGARWWRSTPRTPIEVAVSLQRQAPLPPVLPAETFAVGVFLDPNADCR